MIRNTLARTQEATFSILLPDPSGSLPPWPTGTGFFISPDGWFATAAHVLTEDGHSDGKIRDDIGKGFLEKESRDLLKPGPGCRFLAIDIVITSLDFALLKIDFEKNKNNVWLEGRSDFPFVEISTRDLGEAEAIYSFGYPLSKSFTIVSKPVKIGGIALSPRVTSAIIASTLVETKLASSPGDHKLYVLDKALNYGNSGGPIVATETGYVHAICTRFQEVFIPQPHLTDMRGRVLQIMTPSLYGIVTSLNNPQIIEALEERGIPLSEA